MDSSEEKLISAYKRKYIKKYSHQIVALGLLVLVFSMPSIIDYASKPAIPKIGEIARQDVIATISFDVLKPDSLWRAESLVVVRSVPVVLKYNPKIEDSVLSAFDSVWSLVVAIVDSEGIDFSKKSRLIAKIFPNLDEQQRERLILLRGIKDFGKVVKAALRIAYSDGFVSSNPLPGEKRPPELFSIKTGRHESVYSRSLVANDSTIMSEIEDYVRRQYTNSPEKVELACAIAKRFLVPNLVPDIEETNKKREKALSKISRKLLTVEKGEKVIGKYERVDEEKYLKLLWYYRTLERRSLAGGVMARLGAVLGTFLLVSVIVLMLGVFLAWKYPDYWNNEKFVWVLTGVFAVVGVISVVLRQVGLSMYAYPVLMVPVVFAFLGEDWMAFASSVGLISLVAVGLRGDIVFTLSYLLASGVLCFRARTIQFRALLYRPIIWATLSGILAVVVLNFVLFGVRDYGWLFKSAAEFGVSSVLAPFLGLLLLPVAEKISGYTSLFTLMDLADLNSALLKKLSVEAPGTYNHSVLVGNAAAAAAEAIGANSILARVGGYYHDIGKLVNPQYFEENQLGRNPHQNLSPFESYRIIVSHTTEGVEIGKLHKLPPRVLDIIQQHHGTSVVEYFYLKAKSINPTVTPDEFRYPGPKPQFKEAAIVMICDVVEAALRSRKDLLPNDLSQIKSFARRLVLDKIEDGQFDEVNLSMADINKILDTIAPIYRGVYHSRGVHEVVGEEI